nr:hypothetical protein [Borreliella bissettiae]
MANSIDETGPLDQKSFKVFFTAIGEENELTNKVKERQILVILGNPPYNSIQKIIMNIYVLNLVNDYKKIENKSINEKI